MNVSSLPNWAQRFRKLLSEAMPKKSNKIEASLNTQSVRGFAGCKCAFTSWLVSFSPLPALCSNRGQLQAQTWLPTVVEQTNVPKLEC